MEAMKLNEIKPYMMYVFEPLRTYTIHHCHLWTVVASYGLHFQKKMIFSYIKCICAQLLLQYHKRCALRTSKRYIVRFTNGHDESIHHGHLWTLVASNGLHFQKKIFIFIHKMHFFSIFNTVPYKIYLKDLKKVYC